MFCSTFYFDSTRERGAKVYENMVEPTHYSTSMVNKGVKFRGGKLSCFFFALCSLLRAPPLPLLQLLRMHGLACQTLFPVIWST